MESPLPPLPGTPLDTFPAFLFLAAATDIVACLPTMMALWLSIFAEAGLTPCGCLLAFAEAGLTAPALQTIRP